MKHLDKFSILEPLCNFAYHATSYMYIGPKHIGPKQVDIEPAVGDNLENIEDSPQKQ